ncbi:hypothetical protein B0I35DRAFT_447198 [Stachybotrys elegans]|uniref:Uncharacterized protein n=1 Tax=Stachybotrys elegans TaxID=80388 RepID=A0A8K0SF45_9HYPO|nr:hypothetical protein B0I35DRAFT_447503 [Stachybotrys elegans]KAH7303125.1 hypothetical protein B0I35DRAFT_447198 [Stachybotrys elegans]
MSASQPPLEGIFPLPPESGSKRTANDTLQRFPPKKGRTSTSSFSIEPPKPLSINSALQSRERLYVHPLHWGARHLELLGVEFREEARQESQPSDDKLRKELKRNKHRQASTEAIEIKCIRRAVYLLRDELGDKASAIRYLLDVHGIRHINYTE